MSLSPDLSQGVYFPTNTGEVVDRLKRGETVVVEFGSTLDFYLSDMDTPLPEGGRIIYQSELPAESVVHEAAPELQELVA